MMFLLIASTRLCLFNEKIMYFKLFLIFALPTYGGIFAFPVYETEVNSTLPSSVIADDYIDYYDELVRKGEFCSQANLEIAVNPDYKKNKIVVAFELTKEEFKDCFKYFDIFLKKNKKEVASAKVSFNYKINKRVTYLFENITCGLYEVTVKPCYTDWQCINFIVKYPKLVNMSGLDCNGMLPLSLQMPHAEKIHMKIISILTVVAILLTLSTAGFAYCHYNSIHIVKKKEEKVRQEKEYKNLIETAVVFKEPENVFTRIKVYILHYSNEVILTYVEILKDLLSKLPNVEVVLIQDELHKILFDRTWWVNDALEIDEYQEEPVEKVHTIKKIIIVDAAKKSKGESGDTLENENENEIFDEAKTKLGQDWLRSLNDYDRIFVVRFNGLSQIKSEALRYVVPEVRYDIPDNQLISLCEILLSGSGFESHFKKEDIVELIEQHPIKNLNLTETESCYV